MIHSTIQIFLIFIRIVSNLCCRQSFVDVRICWLFEWVVNFQQISHVEITLLVPVVDTRILTVYTRIFQRNSNHRFLLFVEIYSFSPVFSLLKIFQISMVVNEVHSVYNIQRIDFTQHTFNNLTNPILTGSIASRNISNVICINLHIHPTHNVCK